MIFERCTRKDEHMFWGHKHARQIRCFKTVNEHFAVKCLFTYHTYTQPQTGEHIRIHIPTWAEWVNTVRLIKQVIRIKVDWAQFSIEKWNGNGERKKRAANIMELDTIKLLFLSFFSIFLFFNQIRTWKKWSQSIWYLEKWDCKWMRDRGVRKSESKSVLWIYRLFSLVSNADDISDVRLCAVFHSSHLSLSPSHSSQMVEWRENSNTDNKTPTINEWTRRDETKRSEMKNKMCEFFFIQ